MPRSTNLCRVTEPRSYSISVRLRRTLVEEGYVKVPVTGDVMSPPEADGTLRLDTDKLFAEAVRLGGDLAEWTTEESAIEVHPIQKAPPGIFDA